MEEKYIYNTKTRKLHIRGGCQHTKGLCADYMMFDTEDDALAYDGRAVSVCKLCQKKRDQQIRTRKEG